jgi:hypothetical protein
VPSGTAPVACPGPCRMSRSLSHVPVRLLARVGAVLPRRYRSAQRCPAVGSGVRPARHGGHVHDLPYQLPGRPVEVAPRHPEPDRRGAARHRAVGGRPVRGSGLGRPGAPVPARRAGAPGHACHCRRRAARPDHRPAGRPRSPERRSGAVFGRRPADMACPPSGRPGYRSSRPSRRTRW